MHQVVMDIDLDFFVTPIHRAANSDNDPRLPNEEFTVDDPEQVDQFMRYGFGLDPKEPVPGAVVTHHQEVFTLWDTLVQKGQLSPKFSVFHVDAHDDVSGWEKKPEIRSDNYLI